MTKNGKMQQVVVRVLAVMLAASFLLAVASFVWFTPVSAEYYTVCSCYECEYAGSGYCNWIKQTKIVQGSSWHCTDWVCASGGFYCGFDGCD